MITFFFVVARFRLHISFSDIIFFVRFFTLNFKEDVSDINGGLVLLLGFHEQDYHLAT